ncbi:MAG: hypothetical protein ACPGVC_10270 [Salibacteraceae bacterium]
MSENTSQNKEEEIDLGQLFTLVGKGFSKIVVFIQSIIDFVLKMLIGILLFFKRHFIKFVIAAIVGVVMGWIIDKAKDPEFEATMVVKPNYESGRQLYKNIAFYDELIQQENFELLAQTFNISLEEAQTLVSFEIEPVINENYMLSTYDEFLSSIDSNVALNFQYQSYTDNFKDYSFSEHEIKVTSTVNNVFVKLEEVIVSGVKSNVFFQKLEESERLILARNKAYLQATLNEVDTLRKVYTDVLIKESEKETSQGTNISMAASEESTKELSLFAQENKINEEKNMLTRSEVRNIEIINVISNFQKIGFRKSGLTERWTVRIPLIFTLLLLFGLVFKELNSQVLNKK